MLINKEIGKWCNDDFVTELDDLAYQCLINKFYENEYLIRSISISQVRMMYDMYHYNSFNDEYTKATILLRSEKINKIRNGNNDR